MHLAFLALLIALPTVTPQPVERTPSWRAELTVSLANLDMVDPLGWCGDVPFTAHSSEVALELDGRRLSLTAETQLPRQDFGQSRVLASGRWLPFHPGRFDIGLMIDYRRFTFSHPVASIDKLGIQTKRSGQIVTAGLAMRFRGPLHLTFWSSWVTGVYDHRYENIVSFEQERVSESRTAEHPTIGRAELAVQTSPLLGRIRLLGSATYTYLQPADSSWLPRSTWSGRAAIDVRAIGYKRFSLHLGTGAELGSHKLSPMSDRSFDVHASVTVQ